MSAWGHHTECESNFEIETSVAIEILPPCRRTLSCYVLPLETRKQMDYSMRHPSRRKENAGMRFFMFSHSNNGGFKHRFENLRLQFIERETENGRLSHLCH